MFQLNNTNKTFVFIALYLTVLVGFFINENSTGGALIDFKMRINIIDKFHLNFLETFKNYDKFGDRHSPVILILLSILSRFGVSIDVTRFIHLHLLILILLLSYRCLILKYANINKNLLYLISLVFLLSPTMRSNAIWPDSRVLGFLIFLCSLFFFIKFQKNREFKNCLYNNILLVCSAYISPNFSLFFIYFFYHYIKYYGVSKNIFKIIFINSLLSLPMLLYLFVLKVNFLSIVAIPEISIFTRLNIFNKVLIISTLIFFYLIPFTLNKYVLNKFYNNFNRNILFLCFGIFFLSLYFFNYSINFTGGGIFFKLSYFIFNNNYLFYLISITSLIVIGVTFKFNSNNILLFLILILSNPQLTIYHKYYDPLLIVLYFLLFEFKFDIRKVINNKYIYNIYFFYIIFLAINLSRNFYKLNF